MAVYLLFRCFIYYLFYFLRAIKLPFHDGTLNLKPLQITLKQGINVK